jgi:copper transport protein
VDALIKGALFISSIAGAFAPSAATNAPALPHAHLIASEPADGDTITTHPLRVRLVFSEPVEENLGQVLLVDLRGDTRSLVPVRDPSDVHSLIAPLPELAPGGYRVDWRVVSADGHPVKGSFAFYFAPAADAATDMGGGVVDTGDGAAGMGTTLPPAPTAGHEAQHPGMSSPATEELPVGAAIVRGAARMALIGWAGLLAVLAWVVRLPPRRLARLCVFLGPAALLLLVADFMLWLQHVAGTSQIDLSQVESALNTQNGRLTAARIALAGLGLWGLVLARRMALAAIFAMLAVVLTGAAGHPSAMRPLISMPSNAVHVAAVALWLGGLLTLALGRRQGAEFLTDAVRVSAVALVAVLVISLTGALQAVVFLQRPADLLSSTYGLLVVAKVLGLGVLVLFGWRHRYRLIPALATGAPPTALQRSVSREVLAMAAVIMLAAFLAYTPPPMPAGTAEAAPEGTRKATATAPPAHATFSAHEPSSAHFKGTGIPRP